MLFPGSVHGYTKSPYPFPQVVSGKLLSAHNESIRIMREPASIFLMLFMIACLFLAGCMQSTASRSVPPAGTAAIVPAPEPVTPVLQVTTPVLPEVVTVIRYVSPPRDLKDSHLLFTLQVPAEWNVSTTRMTNADTSDYRTRLVAGDGFSIYHYPITRSREQEFRDRFRQWIPAPVETPVTTNGIRYDRYESSAGGNTSVAYLARTTSANERGYGSVLVFTAQDSNRFEREDFEQVVSSFRYFSLRSAGSVAGDEIPVYDLAGKAVSRGVNPLLFNTSDWDTSGSGNFDDSGTPGSSGEGTPGGGPCGG
jgi:hypothetical protein